MTNPWNRKLVLAIIMEAMTILFISEAVAAPVFTLGKWSGDVELGYLQSRQETHEESVPTDKNVLRRYDEQVTIRNQGFYLMDPRLLTGDLALTYGEFQQRNHFSDDLQSDQNENGRLTGYAFDTSLLAAKPYSGMFFANRNQSVSDREFGGRTDSTFESHGAAFRLREDSFFRDWGVPYFSSTLSARQEHMQENTDEIGQKFQRDETRNTATLEAKKGFETADLSFRYEAVNDEDRVRPQNAYETQSANLNYSRDFGPTLNRRWDSRMEFFNFMNQNSANQNSRTYYLVDEGVRIDHNVNLFTNYRYLFTRVATEAGYTTRQSGTILAQHRLYKNLTTTYTAQGAHTDQPNDSGTLDSYAGQVDLNYRRALTPGRRVFVRLGGRSQINDNNLKVSQIDVNDEPHIAPSPLGGSAGFTLSNPFVITSTIVVVDARGGGRLPTTYGVDYDIVQEGDYTKIVPLATSPVINAGDPLLVSYSYEVSPSIRYSTDSWWLSGGLDFSWLAVSYIHEVFDQTLLGGHDGKFLDDRQTDTAQLELRGDWRSVQARANAMQQIQDSTRLAYTRRQYGQFLSYRPQLDLVLAVDAQESITDYTLPEQRENRFRSIRFTLDRTVHGGWYTTVFAGERVTEDTLLETETVREAGIKARRSYGKLDVIPSLTWSDRKRGPVEFTDTRVEVRLVRRFF